MNFREVVSIRTADQTSSCPSSIKLIKGYNVKIVEKLEGRRLGARERESRDDERDERKVGRMKLGKAVENAMLSG
jgi:hypothetical protein